MARRIARLEQEIDDELDLTLDQEALEELAYAKYMEPHEGQRPAYGAIVLGAAPPTGRPRALPLKSAGAFVESQAPSEVLRRFADGRTSFLMRGAGIRPSLVIDPAWKGDESTLAAYAAEEEVTVIQRLASGRVRIYCSGHVYSEQDGIWLARPSADSYQERLADLIPVQQHVVARSILDLCVHTLSPAGHGATLVWFPEAVDDMGDNLDLSVALVPPALSASDATHAPGIAHALGQMDRAAILEPSGRLTHLNVTLEHSDGNADMKFGGGTRHNSAGRYSASDERAVVFVVSADGPVTVIHKGDIVATIGKLG